MKYFSNLKVKLFQLIEINHLAVLQHLITTYAIYIDFLRIIAIGKKTAINQMTEKGSPISLGFPLSLSIISTTGTSF